jgi:enamine deaminase RidA (YjgF/YER057c/UK114 family)
LAADPQVIEPNPKTGQSLAVRVPAGPLVHTGQIAPLGPSVVPTPPEDQVREAFARLDSILRTAGSSLKQAVKLNVYVHHNSVTPLVERELAARFNGMHQPAVSWVQTPYREPAVMLSVDAVATTSTAVEAVKRLATLGSTGPAQSAILPAGGAVYISGQAEKGDGTLADATRQTMTSLFASLKFADLEPDHVVHVKAFLTPMSRASTAVKEITAVFGKATPPPVTLVEWESSLPIEIELIAASPSTNQSEVEYLTPPGMSASPVFCRLVRVPAGDRLYVSGLFGTQKDPNSADEVHDLFRQLTRALDAGGSDLRHLVKATYYVTDDAISQQLNDVRPEYFDPARPPAASKAMVSGTGRPGRHVTLDMLAVPVRRAE